MPYKILLAPEAVEDLGRLRAYDKAKVTLDAHDRGAATDLKVLQIALDKARREVAQACCRARACKVCSSIAWLMGHLLDLPCAA